VFEGTKVGDFVLAVVKYFFRNILYYRGTCNDFTLL
jgi:hypothetical protein